MTKIKLFERRNTFLSIRNFVKSTYNMIHWQKKLISRKFCSKLVREKFQHTVWKIHNYSVIQILHEINFRECRSSKTTFFAIIGALNFVILVNFSLHKNQNLEPVNVLKGLILQF